MMIMKERNTSHRKCNNLMVIKRSINSKKSRSLSKDVISDSDEE